MLTDQHREAEDSLGESADGRWQKRLTNNWSEFVFEQHGTQWSGSGNRGIFTSNGSSHLDLESELANEAAAQWYIING